MIARVNRVCGVVLLRADDAALLQLRDEKPEIAHAGQWVFPGGNIEPDETPEQGAHREFIEEACYQCAELNLLLTCPGNDLGYHEDVEFTFFWERFDGLQRIRCCEGQELRFIKRSQAEHLPTPAYLPRIWDLALVAKAELGKRGIE
jgi:8-oxo-dGTP pyrophosphatase MutT (NUDIX family)